MRLCKLALVLGVAVLLASPALAQRGRGGFGFLLQIEKVQKDLGLDKDGVKKVDEALQKVREDHKDDLDKMRDPDTKQEERAEILKKFNAANEKALKGVLSEKQMKRLKEIQRQVMGIDMFSDEEVQKTLKLDDKQKEKIKEINQ